MKDFSRSGFRRLMVITIALACALSTGRAYAITLTQITTGFNNPIGIDHHQPTNQLVMSVHYPSGSPHNFELVAADGSRVPFSAASGLTDEVKIGTARDGLGGFTPGELFVGTGVGGRIARISADGSVITNPWVVLPGETGLMRGSLHVDRTGVFGGDLIAVTTAGGVWRINSAGIMSFILRLTGVHLEGLTTVPNDVAKYGPWAGKILAGAEAQGRIYAIAPDGSFTFHALGIAPEDFDIIPANENFFGVDFGGARLMGAPPSEFAGMVGDVLVAQEFPGILWHVRWDAANNAFVATNIAQVAQWEHVTFSTAGVREIPPVLNCPSDMSVSCTSEIPPPDAGAIVCTALPDCVPAAVQWIGDFVAGDNCSGTVTRLYRCTDNCGNVSECRQVFTYRDTIPPVITSCPPDLTVESADDLPGCDDLEGLEYSENCGGVFIECTRADVPSTTCGQQPTAIDYRYIVSDSCSNADTCMRTVTIAPPPCPVSIDIKPRSCPNPFELQPDGSVFTREDNFDLRVRTAVAAPASDRSVLPVAILGSADLDVADIDPETVLLNGVTPLRSNIADVAAPVGAAAEECECTTAGPDGYADLTLKFNRAAIAATLGAVADGDYIELTLTANLYDGTAIAGVDCILIRLKGKGSISGSPDAPFELESYPNPFNAAAPCSSRSPGSSRRPTSTRRPRS